jgi:large subunit ribosomal protein L29
MKANDLTDLSVEQLQQKLTELREERFRLRFNSATQTVDNPIRFRTLRRDIARVLTVLRQRESGNAPARAAKA